MIALPAESLAAANVCARFAVGCFTAFAMPMMTVSMAVKRLLDTVRQRTALPSTTNTRQWFTAASVGGVINSRNRGVRMITHASLWPAAGRTPTLTELVFQ